MGKPMARERWMSNQAGFSPALSGLLQRFGGSEITNQEEANVLKGVASSNIWCLPYYDNIDDVENLTKVSRALYKIVEVCRLYGHSVVVVPTTHFNRVAYATNPWINSGNYIEAVVKTDLVIAEGVYPDKTDNLEDWKMLELAFSRRATGKNKPSIFLDTGFKNLPVVGQAMAAKAVQDQLDQEERDAQS
jgi:hypothetical protein